MNHKLDPDMKIFLEHNNINVEQFLTVKDEDEYNKFVNLVRISMNEGKYNLIYNKSQSKSVIIWIFIVFMVVFPFISIFISGLKAGIYMFFIFYSVAILSVTFARLFNQIGNKPNYISLAKDTIIIFRRIPIALPYRDIKHISFMHDKLISINIGAFFPLIIMAKIDRPHEFLREFGEKYKNSTSKSLKIEKKDKNFHMHYS